MQLGHVVEVACRGIIHDVDQGAQSSGLLSDGLIGRFLIRRGEDERRAKFLQDFRLPVYPQPAEFLRINRLPQRCIQHGANDYDARAGLQQPSYLARRHRAAAHDDAGFATQLEGDRITHDMSLPSLVGRCMVWMPHSVLLKSCQRPLRADAPASTGCVQCVQPMVG